MKAGLQEWATASWRFCRPWPPFLLHRMTRPSTVLLPEQWKELPLPTRFSSNAMDSVRIL